MHSTISNKSTNLKEKIPVQVKGITVKKFSEKTRKYQIRINDLESYLRDGGAIFFVVEIIDSKKTKIYYTSLIPIEIDDLLSRKKEGQKTIAVELKILDESDIKYIENICYEFLFHRECQFSTIKHRLSIEDMENLDKLSFTIFAPREHLFNYILENEIILYGQKKNDTLKFPISKVKPEVIVHPMDFKISINSNIYFESYKVEKSTEHNVIILGENIRINLEETKFDFKFKGSLAIRLKEIKFLKDAIKIGHFYIDKHKIDGITSTAKEIKMIEEHYKQLIEIKNLLEFFNIEEDLELDYLTEEELFKLKMLIDIILYNKKEKYKLSGNGPMHFKIGNIGIAVLVKTNNTGELEVYNFFDCNEEIECRLISDDKQINEKGCIYTILKAEDIVKINNLDLQKLEDSIKSIPYSEIYAFHVNALILELIKSYDIEKRLIDCLSTAINLCGWLDKYAQNSEIYKMNKFQAIKRTRDLNKKEKYEIIKIREKFKENFTILCGVSILLENKTDFEYYFENMDKGEQDEFKSFPIYKLAENFGFS